MTALVYRGGSTLTFGLASGGRLTVKNGEPFEVDEALAEILLADPHVELAPAASSDGEGNDPEDPRETPLASKTKAELLAIAGELGLELPARATNPSIVSAIEAEHTRLADEASEASSDGEGNEGGEDAPGEDPEASAAGEPGPPPSTTGAITLGGLPEGARIQKDT